MFDVIPINDETWLICGGRDFSNQEMFDSAMGDLIRLKGAPARIIHGNADGADLMADMWAHRHATPCSIFSPDWKTKGPAAGPIRNQRMIDEGKPNFVVAFPGGKGTADMVKRAKAAGLDIAEIQYAESKASSHPDKSR